MGNLEAFFGNLRALRLVLVSSTPVSTLRQSARAASDMCQRSALQLKRKNFKKNPKWVSADKRHVSGSLLKYLLIPNASGCQVCSLL